jgi:hypothetical protein
MYSRSDFLFRSEKFAHTKTAFITIRARDAMGPAGLGQW